MKALNLRLTAMSLLLALVLLGGGMALVRRDSLTVDELPTLAPTLEVAVAQAVNMETSTVTPFETETATATSSMTPTTDTPTETVSATSSPTLAPTRNIPTLPPTAVEVSVPTTEPIVVAPPSEPVPDVVIVRVDPSQLEQLQADVASQGGTVELVDEALGAVTIQLPNADALEEVTQAEYVEASEPDYFVSVQQSELDPLTDQQWSLSAMNIPTTVSADARAIKVAVIDSGVCDTHPELNQKIIGGYDYVQSDSTPQDEMGHGCAVAGIIASAVNGVGMVGVAPNAQLLIYRVLNANGSGRYSHVASAIVRAVDDGAQIINLSLGGANASQLLQDAVTYALERNVLVVAAAGNNGSGSVLYPALYEGVISVGASGRDLNPATFSNYGKIDLWAPGVEVLSLTLQGEYASFNGTSFAAPNVSGLLARNMGVGVPVTVRGGGFARYNDETVVVAPSPTGTVEVVGTPDNSGDTVLDSTLESAVLEAGIRNFPDVESELFAVSQPDTYSETWAFGSLVVRAETGEHGSPWLWLYIAQKVDGVWEVYFENDQDFTVALENLPQDFLSSEISQALEMSLYPQGDGSAQLSLPFATGESWTLTGGPHDCCRGDNDDRAALDFQLNTSGTGIVRAANEGTVWRSGTCPNFIRVDHPNGWKTGYYHMVNEAVSNGQWVSRGQHIGQEGTGVGCGGYVTGPHVHFSLRDSSDNPNSWNGKDLGGYTVQQGGSAYQGCLVRVSTGQSFCQWSRVTNYGDIGTGAVVAPLNTNLIQNGDFNNGTRGWNKDSDVAWEVYGEGITGNTLAYKTNSYPPNEWAMWGPLWQNINNSFPQGSGILVEFDYSNQLSDTTKYIGVNFHQHLVQWDYTGHNSGPMKYRPRYDSGYNCLFAIPPRQGTVRYKMYMNVPFNWTKADLMFENHSANGRIGLIDNIQVIRQSTSFVSGNRCEQVSSTPTVPFNTNLVQNGDFNNGVTSWTKDDDASWEISQGITGNTLKFTTLAKWSEGGWWGPLWQSFNYSFPQNTGVLIEFDYSNQLSDTTKYVGVNFYQNRLSDTGGHGTPYYRAGYDSGQECLFTIPPRQGTVRYKMYMNVPANWVRGELMFEYHSANGRTGMFDNIKVTAQSTPFSTSVRCEQASSTPSVPFNTNLVQNGDFNNGVTSWTKDDDASWEISQGITGNTLKFTTLAKWREWEWWGPLWQSFNYSFPKNTGVLIEFDYSNQLSDTTKYVGVNFYQNRLSDTGGHGTPYYRAGYDSGQECLFTIPPRQGTVRYKMYMNVPTNWVRGELMFEYHSANGRTGMFDNIKVTAQSTPFSTSVRCEQTGTTTPPPINPPSPSNIEVKFDISEFWILGTKPDYFDNLIFEGTPVNLNVTLNNLSSQVAYTPQIVFYDVLLNQEILRCSMTSNLPQNSVGRHTCQWNPPTGYAWNVVSPKTQLNIRAHVKTNGQTYQSNIVEVKIGPRPIVLVQGLNSTYEAWKFDGKTHFHPNQWIYRAGDGQDDIDGRQHTITIDLGGWGLISPVLGMGKSIEENSERLDTYIDRIRRKYNINQVDLVAHSTGALVSRQYIVDFMDTTQDGRPVVNAFVSLGGANRGSWMADTVVTGKFAACLVATNGQAVFACLVLADQGTVAQVTTLWVQQYINLVYNNDKGVAFMAVAAKDDKVVGYDSARALDVPLGQSRSRYGEL